jgi:hypothetical protein
MVMVMVMVMVVVMVIHKNNFKPKWACISVWRLINLTIVDIDGI